MQPTKKKPLYNHTSTVDAMSHAFPCYNEDFFCKVVAEQGLCYTEMDLEERYQREAIDIATRKLAQALEALVYRLATKKQLKIYLEVFHNNQSLHQISKAQGLRIFSIYAHLYGQRNNNHKDKNYTGGLFSKIKKAAYDDETCKQLFTDLRLIYNMDINTINRYLDME